MRILVRRVACALALLLGASVVGACAAQGPAGPTKAQYLAAGNNVCNVTHGQVLALVTAQKKASADLGAQQVFVTTVLIPRLRTMVSQLASLQPPDGDGPYVGSIYGDYLHALAVWYLYPLGTESQSNRDAVDARLKSYGLDGCVKAPDPRPGDAPPGPTTTTVAKPA